MFEMGHSLETRFTSAPGLISFRKSLFLSCPRSSWQRWAVLPVGEAGIGRCTDVKQCSAPLSFRLSVVELAHTAVNTEADQWRNKKLLYWCRNANKHYRGSFQLSVFYLFTFFKVIQTVHLSTPAVWYCILFYFIDILIALSVSLEATPSGTVERTEIGDSIQKDLEVLTDEKKCIRTQCMLAAQ